MVVGSILNLTNVDPTNGQDTIVFSFPFRRVSVRRRKSVNETKAKELKRDRIARRLESYERSSEAWIVKETENEA